MSCGCNSNPTCPTGSSKVNSTNSIGYIAKQVSEAFELKWATATIGSDAKIKALEAKLSAVELTLQEALRAAEVAKQAAQTSQANLNHMEQLNQQMVVKLSNGFNVTGLIPLADGRYLHVLHGIILGISATAAGKPSELDKEGS